MFTNQKVLGALLTVFLIGAATYFTYSKFKQEVSIPLASPSPSPSNLNFLFNQPTPTLTPAPQQTNQQPIVQKVQPTPEPTQLPLAKVKHLAGFPGIVRDDIRQNKKAVIQTQKGIIQLKIYPEASMAASNFMILAANGFYDGLIFHRVQSGFVVQGGDPLGDGTGGPGYQFPDEPIGRNYLKGTVAYANSGPNTNGSQFFIMLADHPELPKQYVIFGQVISGMDIVEKLAVGDVMQKVVIQEL